MAWLNLPAVFITAAITVVLVIGVKESAGLNAAMVLLNIGVILYGRGHRRGLRRAQELATLFCMKKKAGGAWRRGRADFLRLYRVRLDLDPCRGSPAPAARPGDRHDGSAHDLHGLVSSRLRPC